jgi:hypothetical protein
MQKRKIDPDVIRGLVDEGLSAQEIADRVGWTVGSLRVRCSQLKISLRRSGNSKSRMYLAVPKAIFGQLKHHAIFDGYLGKRAGNGPPQNDRTGRPL